MADETKVFISWSGSYSKLVAVALRTWLEELFDNVRPFVSDRDIDPGARSMAVIERELADTSFGIVIITQESQIAPWLNFEAGALSKEVGDSTNRVVPLLMDMDSPAELTGPIAQFQAQRFDEAGMLRIVEGIAAVIGANVEAVRRRFTRSWAEFEADVAAIPPDEVTGDAPARRGVEEMVEETLTIVRSLEQTIGRRTGTSPNGQNVAVELEILLSSNKIDGKVEIKQTTSGPQVEVSTSAAPEHQVALINTKVSELIKRTGIPIVYHAVPF